MTRPIPTGALNEHSSTTTPHVIIVGCGFGGLEAAKALRNAPVRVTVVDRRNHHLFQPLLYQVATAGLSPSDIAAPIRSILRHQRNTHVFLAEVQSIDLADRTLQLTDGATVTYDYLIVAAGGRTTYFGHDDWARLAPGLKSIEDALEIRRRVLLAYEAAERTHDQAERQRLLTFAVIGGGPTGVELAGALAEIARQTLRHDFRAINPAEAHIILIESGSRLLSTFPEPLSASARRQLERLGVEVITGSLVTALSATTIQVDSGQQIEAATILWGAGVIAVPLTIALGVSLDRTGRIVVEPDLSLPGHPEVFAVGDIMTYTHQGAHPLPGVAPVAMQSGRAAAQNIQHRLRGEPTQPFRYKNRGNMAIIGRLAGVADLGWLRLTGIPAWLSWLVIHLWYLVGFQNRLRVFTQWAWSYLTFQRGARLITGAVHPVNTQPTAEALPAGHHDERDRSLPR